MSPPRHETCCWRGTPLGSIEPMADAEATAWQILTDLEEGLATHDLDRMVDLFTDDVVLLGDDDENWDREATVAYLSLMAEMTYTVRWEWDRVAVLVSE